MLSLLSFLPRSSRGCEHYAFHLTDPFFSRLFECLLGVYELKRDAGLTCTDSRRTGSPPRRINAAFVRKLKAKHPNGLRIEARPDEEVHLDFRLGAPDRRWDQHRHEGVLWRRHQTSGVGRAHTRYGYWRIF